MINPALGLVGRLHSKFVFGKRTDILASEIAKLLPQNAKTLDIGCGDGTIDRKILKLRPDLAIQGVEVAPRTKTAIPVVPFDGMTIPYPKGSFDCSIFVDVLHHVNEPEKLLSEAKRVTRKFIVIKDHFSENPLDTLILKTMDWIGNKPHEVVLPYNYLSKKQWENLWNKAGLKVVSMKTNLDLYPLPFSLIFDRKLHFIARMETRT